MIIPRSALIITAIALILVALIPAAVSANEIVYDDDLIESVDTSASGEQYYSQTSQSARGKINQIAFTDITKAQTLYYLVFEIPGDRGTWENGTKLADGSNAFTYHFNGEDRPGVVHVTRKTNLLGQVTSTVFTVFLHDWDIGDLTGTQYVICPFDFDGSGWVQYGTRTKETNVYLAGDGLPSDRIKITEVTAISWKHYLMVEQDSISYFITIDGEIDGNYYNAEVNFSKNGEVFSSFANTGKELYFAYPKQNIDLIKIISPSGMVYSYPLGSDIPGDPGTSPVSIYVKSSQTGGLLADAHIEIQDTTTDPWTEVVNQTLPSGHGTIFLAKDPGLHLTQYRIGATVPGYQQVVPALFFRVTGPTNVVVEMEPLEGGPVDENNTYLEFYVRDLNANGISNAQVFVDGQLRWTNAAGYTQFEVAKNASYPYTVGKSGYVTIEGTATVADDPRYVVNVVLGPKEIPTNPPATDPGGPGATPTPDRRTNEEKGQAVIDMIADNAEGIGALALICLLMGLLKLMAKW